MKIRLVGWDSRGLRCPDGKVNLIHGDKVSRVSLIQMPNGTGKTTTLSLLRAALTGEAESWSSDRIGEFRRDGDEAKVGTFIVRLQIDDTPLTVEMQLDFLSGHVRYKTSSPSMGGLVHEWRPPRGARRFMNDKFVSLFVFDAELANKLLKASESTAETAIDALCQLDLLDEVLAVSESSWKGATKDRGAKTTQGLAALKNRESELEAQIRRVTSAEAEALDNLERIEVRISAIQREIGERISSDTKVQKELERLRLEKVTRESEVASAVSSAVQLIRQPQKLDGRLASALIALKTNLDKSRLPDSTSRQFFVELAQEEHCVCGRPIGPNEREHIQAEADRYLGEDISGVINALKQDVDTQVALLEDVASLEGSVRRLAEAETDLQKVDTDLQAEQARADNESDSDIAVLRGEYEGLVVDREELKGALEEIRRPARTTDEETGVCLSALRRMLNEAQKKIAEATDTVELRLKTNIVQEMAKKAKQRARDHLKRVLVDESNERLRQVLGSDPIQIAEIRNCLVLAGQREASVGQTLAVGYTFLATALHRGSHEFPLVVDSPAGPLDHKVRREIGLMVPKLCEQFVAFTISTERAGFVPALEQTAGRGMQYITIFRKTPGTAQLLVDLPKTGVAQTHNGVLVEGRDYFNQFAVEEEVEA